MLQWFQCNSETFIEQKKKKNYCIVKYKILTCSFSGAMDTLYLQQPDDAIAEGVQTENLSCSPITVQEVAYQDRALLKHVKGFK